MKKPKSKLIAVLLSFCSLLVLIDLLLFCLFLSGCNKKMKNYFYTESSLKRVAAKTLKKKYGEEFEIYYAWPRDQTIFYVTCSPKRDMDVVFEAQIYKDGSGIFDDEYLQGVVSKQLSERIQAKLQGVFGDDCYVKAHFYGDPPTIDELMETYEGEAPSYDYFKKLTVEEYYQLVEDPYLAIWIFVNKEHLDDGEEQIREEFECLSQLFVNEPMKEAGASCYFVDENMLNECQEYLKKDSKARGDFKYMVEDVIEFGFGFDYGDIRESFEEYNEVRKEVKTNE